MWDVFYLPETRNKENKWGLFLNQYIFPLDYTKHHVKSLQKYFKADKYIVQNLKWSGVYLRSTLLYAILQKELELVPLTKTGSEVYVANMNTVLSYYCDSLVGNMNHMKSLKLVTGGVHSR